MILHSDLRTYIATNNASSDPKLYNHECAVDILHTVLRVILLNIVRVILLVIYRYDKDATLSVYPIAQQSAVK